MRYNNIARKYSWMVGICIAFLAVSSCKRDTAFFTSGSYVIIGYQGGFAAPYTSNRYFLIDNTSLTEDTGVSRTNLPATLSQFHFNITVADSVFQKVKQLPKNIPAILLSQNGSSFGRYIPDFGCYDIRTTVNGVDYKWTFGYDLSGCDPAIQNFVSTAILVFR
jgi:hypothetical protein